MRRALAGTFVGGCVATLALAHCASFGTSAEPVASAVSDAATEAALTSDPAADAGASVLVSEGFENGTFPFGWTVSGVSADLGIETDGDAPASKVLALSLAAGSTTPTYLARPLATGHARYRVRARIKVATEGDGELDLFGLYAGGDIKKGELALVHQKGATYAAEIAAPDAVTKAVGPSFVTWTTVTLTLDFVRRTAQYDVGGTSAGEFVFPAGMANATDVAPVVFAGAAYVTDVKGTWKVHYDDIEVTASD